MKVTNYIFNTINELNKDFDLSNINTSTSFLQIFSGKILKNELEEIRQIIIKKNPKIFFIGTTTAGEIYNGQAIHNTIVISVMEFKHTTFEFGHFINENDFNLGIDIALSLFKKTTKVIIILIEGFKINGNDVVDGISSINNTIPIAGGMAGDNGIFKETFIFDNNGVYGDGAVAISLNSNHLNVFTDRQLNWQPIGKYMTITKAEKNRLYEVDNIPIGEIYKKYLGKIVGDNLPHSAAEFALLKIEDDGFEACRAFYKLFDDGSMVASGNFKVGDRVRLSFANVGLVVNNSKKNIEKYNYFKPEAIYIYSCIVRFSFLQNKVNAELEPLENLAHTAGFFTYGEIFHRNNRNDLLNATMTILGLSEDFFEQNLQLSKKNNDNNKQEKNVFNDKHFLTLNALTNLSNQVILELEESKRKIEEKNKLLSDSINYASLIQKTLIPSNELFNNYFSDYFTMWFPKDIVGGDIYLFEELKSKYECLLMVIDCTGHGVSGAFVTMLVKAIQRQILTKINNNNLDVSPALIFTYFNKAMKKLLQQDNEKSISNVGFDGGILYYNRRDKIVKFAGAETSLFYIKDDELQILKGNRHSIGYKKSDINYEFKEYIIPVKKGMKFYITTDGYIDQNGGKKDFPFGKKRFTNLITQFYNKSFIEQKNIFLRELKLYQDKKDRNDDITIVGVEI